MVFSGLEFMGKKPFSTVLINGLVRDEKGKKMSKSSGNGIDPLDIIDKYGADALRFSLTLGIATGADQRFLEEKIESCSNFMNKIFNAGKYVLAATEGKKFNADLAAHTKHISLADKFILTQLDVATKAATKQLNKFETGHAATLLYDFTWDTFCDWYIESAKVTINSDNESAANATRAVLLYVYKRILALLHPFVPHITQYIYSFLPQNTDSIMEVSYGEKIKTYKAASLEFTALQEIVKQIRAFRADNKVQPNNHFACFAVTSEGSSKLLKTALPFINKLASIKCELKEGSFALENSLQILTPLATFYIPKEAISNSAEEKERLQKELKTVEVELALAQKKLANEGFVAKAPPALIASEKAKIEKYTALRDKILAAL